jgi:hypothetical protein
MPNRASETRIAERFATWLSSATGAEYTISFGDDPPDFLLDPNGWLELSDIYLRDEQARFLNVATERSFEFSGPIDETAVRLAAKLGEKLGKESYQDVYRERGKGFLLLTCQDCFFDLNNLVQVREVLASFAPTVDHGFFRTAYFEYQLPGGDRTYEAVYPRKA